VHISSTVLQTMTYHACPKFFKPSNKQHITLNSPFHYTANFNVSHLADS